MTDIPRPVAAFPGLLRSIYKELIFNDYSRSSLFFWPWIRISRPKKEEFMDTRYPDIHVKLVGTDGNAFSILGTVSKAMRRAGLGKTEIDAFMKEAMSGDYNNLLATCMRWVDCDDDEGCDDE